MESVNHSMNYAMNSNNVQEAKVYRNTIDILTLSEITEIVETIIF